MGRKGKVAYLYDGPLQALTTPAQRLLLPVGHSCVSTL